MTALKDLAGRRRFLLVGDSKLISYPNVRDITAANVTFIAPAPKQYVPASVLAACDIGKAVPVDYTARRDAGKPAGDRGAWRVYEDTMVMSPPKGASGPGITLRRVFVYSSARAGAARTARAKKLARAAGDLDRLMRGLGSRHYRDEAAVRARLAVIGKTRRVASLLKAAAGTDAATGKPVLTWEFDAQALQAEAAADGWYALLANLDAAHADAAEVLIRFKGQEASERRYGNYKGPLAVAPLFLKHNRRIEALITVICLALLVFCLIERHIRAQIAPQTTIPGLYAGRPARPTSWLIFLALAGMRLIPATGNRPAVIPQPTPLQRHLLELLGVDPLKPP
jgi:transposase